MTDWSENVKLEAFHDVVCNGATAVVECGTLSGEFAPGALSSNCGSAAVVV